jgi:hypothetical protein
LGFIMPLVTDAIIGLLVGAVCVLIYSVVQFLLKKRSR